MSLLDLALLCLRVGLLSFGGGIATLSEMQHSVVDVHGAMTSADFAYAFGLGQATPGPGVLYLVPLGIKIAGPVGGLVALVAFVLPPLVLVGFLVHTWDRFAGSPWAVAANRTLAPMSVGLIAAGLRTVAAPLVGDPLAIVGVVVATVAILRFRVTPAAVVVTAGIVWMLSTS
jgi:chromate transporter